MNTDLVLGFQLNKSNMTDSLSASPQPAPGSRFSNSARISPAPARNSSSKNYGLNVTVRCLGSMYGWESPNVRPYNKLRTPNLAVNPEERFAICDDRSDSESSVRASVFEIIRNMGSIRSTAELLYR